MFAQSSAITQSSTETLDPRLRSECSWRLEVNGTVETVAGYVYLHAKEVTLVRREKDDTPAP